MLDVLAVKLKLSPGGRDDVLAAATGGGVLDATATWAVVRLNAIKVRIAMSTLTSLVPLPRTGKFGRNSTGAPWQM